MRFEAVLFDFDGTLADTEPLHYQCWRQVLGQAGIELEWPFYRDHLIGISDWDMIERIGAAAGRSQLSSEYQRLYSLKTKSFREISSGLEIIREDIVEAVKSINVNHIGVVTSCEMADIQPILKKAGLLSRLSVQVYSDDVTRLKPAPEPYLTALRRLGAARALVFEDSEAGLESARLAGCHAVRVDHPSSLPGLLAREGLLPPPGNHLNSVEKRR
jgi:HAD superfamily hydrolase (TIGR01509 family)